MRSDELRRRSRWIMRAQEWDEPRARYPNVWYEGMPRHVLAFDTVASRMRLGDLIAVYYPGSQRHRARSERFLGLVRVTALRRAHDPAYAWLDLEIVHRFDKPLDLGEMPRRVFLCCDPGWPARDAGLFRRVFDAAVAEGWKPAPEEHEGPAAEPHRAERGTPAPAPVSAAPEAPVTAVAEAAPAGEGTVESTTSAPDAATGRDDPAAGSRRLFGGATMSGDMRDPRDGSWLALVALAGDHLELIRLEATGRSGLHGLLRDPDEALMKTEAIGLAFPFGVPLDFAESLLGGPFPEEGWWALAKRIERTTLPDYLVALTEFRDARGELNRRTDDSAGAPSPLSREGRDLGAMAYHGIKLIAEERSRFAIRPFERAQGKLLVEVHPAAAAARLAGAEEGVADRRLLISALERAEHLPLHFDETTRRKCVGRAEAFDAVLAARCAAMATLSGETDKGPEELDEAQGERVRREGWIYGLAG